MHEVSKLANEDALEALHELASPKKFVLGHKGNQMDVTVTVTTLDTQRAITTQALVDCGCTGSSINMGFVNRHGLQTRKVARPIPVYNADGTLNSGGPIAEFVDLHVQIQGHKERMSLAVTNLGKSDIFLGYEWLKFHNPSVDWANGTLILDRCPSSCGYLAELQESPEAAEEPYSPEAHLDDGDRVFLMDWATYVAHGSSIHVRAKQTYSQELAAHAHASKAKQAFEDIVPVYY